MSEISNSDNNTDSHNGNPNSFHGNSDISRTNLHNHKNKHHFSFGLVFLFLLAALAIAIYRYSGNIEAIVASNIVSSASERKLPIYCVETNEKKVALSFDAAWGNEDTSKILEILDEYDIKVTFFMTGGWVETYPDDVKAIYAAGHDLGNHSENHKNMSQLSVEECASELDSVTEKVKKLTGYTMELFRPPYGDYDNEVITTAASCGYYAIQWDVDSLDWKNYGCESIITTVLNHENLGNGSIILMHNGAEYTAEALPSVIEGLQNMGYEIVPISELIIRDEYYIDVTGRQCTG